MRKKLLIILLILIPFFLTGRTLEEIKKSGVVYVAFTDASLNSINYDIAVEFAKFLNVELKVINVTWDEIFADDGVQHDDIQINKSYSYTPDALKKADFVCGSIYIVEWRKKLFDFAGIWEVSDLLVVRKKATEWSYWVKLFIPDFFLPTLKVAEIKTYEDLAGKNIALLGNSLYEKNLLKIDKKIGGGINILGTKSEELAQEKLRKGEADGFIAVSYLALKYLSDKKNKNYRLAFPTSKPIEVGWAVEKNNVGLVKEINNFYETIRGNGRLNELFIENYQIDYKTYLEIINSYAESQNTSIRDLDEILESKKIVIALREREMIYTKSGEKQFSHNLAEEFARFLGVELEIKIISSISEYFETDDGKIVKDSAYLPEAFKTFDVACDLLAPVPWRLSKINVIPYTPYAMVVVGRKDVQLHTISDLKKHKGVTAKSSSYEQILNDNKIENYYYAPTPKMLDAVQTGKADYTIVSFSIHSLSDYPNLEAKFIIGEIKKSGWGIKKNQPKLRQKILEFLEYAQTNGILDQHFKTQTGMPFKVAGDYLTALHQTYNIGVFPFVFYGTEEGLPQENILSIFQDKNGYIWYGTYAGAVRFNGKSMRLFDINDGLISNEVFDIAQDSIGSMYFATLRGISVLKNNKFDTIFEKIPFNSIFIDKQKNKWFYGEYGIYMLDKNNYEKQINKEFPILPTNVHSITQNKNGDIFIAAGKGLFVIDAEFNFANRISTEYCYFCFIDEDDMLWVSTKTGLYYDDSEDFNKKEFGQRINEKINIQNTIINKIYQTNDGAIWLISNFNAYQLFSLNQKPIIFDEKIGLSGQRILSFFVDNEGNYWFGYSGGLQKLTNKSLRIIEPKILKNRVNSIVQDEENRMWFALSNGIYTLEDNLINITSSFSESNQPYAVAENSKEEIIIANTTGLFLYNSKTQKIENKHLFEQEISHLENIFISSNNEIFLLTGSEGIVYYFKDFDAKVKVLENTFTTLVFQLTEYDGRIIGGNNTGLIYFDGDGQKFKPEEKINNTVWSVCEIGDSLYVGTENGLGIYYGGEFTLLEIEIPNNSICAILPAMNSEYVWLGTNYGFCYLNIKNMNIEFFVDATDGLPGNEIAINGLQLDGKGLLWVATLHGVATYDIKKKIGKKYTPNTKIETILLNGKLIQTLQSKLKYYENNLSFELTGLSFKSEESLEYDFFLRGLDRDFGSSSGVPNIATYQNLPSGNYEFVYRTKGKDGIWSYYKVLKFEIYKPFWFAWWFIATMIIFVIGIIFTIFKWRERTLKKRNELLEQTVKERTHEIRQQKTAIEQKNTELEQQQEEIISQRDEIAQQRDIAENQRDEISAQQEDIMDSIYYAKRIQTALLPPEKNLDDMLKDYFILFRPRDIVSGDFYWFKDLQDGRVIVCAADCTGHGVPGAFMSMLGSALLDEISLKFKDKLDTALILNELRAHIIDALHQTGKDTEAKDGMDLAIYILDHGNMKLQYSGAFNPLFIIRGEEILETKADRMPIGIFDKTDSFKYHDIELQKGDLIYTFSDGYVSQFGGKKGKKFKGSRLKKLFLSIKDLTMKEQQKMLNKTIENWMGVKHDQVDDVLVIGVKV